MNFFAAFSGRSARQEDTPNLLADWNSYSKGDVEAGASSSGSSDALFQSVDKASSSLSGLFQTSYQTVAKGVGGAAAVLPSADSFRCPSTAACCSRPCNIMHASVAYILTVPAGMLH